MSEFNITDNMNPDLFMEKNCENVYNMWIMNIGYFTIFSKL